MGDQITFRDFFFVTILFLRVFVFIAQISSLASSLDQSDNSIAT
jgi:hypothetical protein